ncbi:MAG: flavin monoamine oxidase family protein [Saprospiraceae bacterium]
MQRRLFLRKIGLGAVGLWAIPQIVQSCTKDPLHAEATPDELADSPWADGKGDRSRVPRSVVVIGAGAAGMYAASWLKARGCTVKILESSERRGGRVKALTGFADFPVELGAEIIHGNNSMLYRWAQQQGAQFVNYSPVDYFRLDGQLFSEPQIEDDPHVIAAWAFSENATSYQGPDKTVAQRVAEVGLPSRVHHIVNADVGNEYGTDNQHLSIKGIAQEDAAWTAGNGDYPMRNRTFAQIMDATFANILPDILYNTKAVRIEYPAGSGKPRVKDQAGVWHTADAVLLTVPLPVLQNNAIEFSPALPTWKTAAIQNIGMGAGMKIIFKFSQRFWASNLRFLTSDQLGHEFWYTSKQRGNDHVLTLFVMGGRAATLSAQGAGAVATVVAELDALYGNNAASSALIGSHIEDWGKNPHIGGAYSFPVVGGGGLATRRDLSKKLNDKLFFAGEATHFAGHSATLHGALETGLRAAKEIRAALK